MLSVEQAEAIIFSRVQALDGEQDGEMVELGEASGRILAAPVTSGLDFPHWDNSAMDGYAVRFADVQDCSATGPASLEVVEEIPAGKLPQRRIESGQAARILTGAMMPDGADTVIMQEVTQRQGDRVLILAAPKPQAFVRYRASYYQAGAPLLEPGIAIAAPEMAILASAQCTRLRVYRRPHVAILSTGDELVRPEEILQPGKIVDSNQYALAALVAASGGIPQLLGIVPDDRIALRNAIAAAISSADIVLSSGGVSVGDYDYVDAILAELSGEIHLRAIAVKPGKPLTFATFSGSSQRSVLYFGLPGNPASSLVTFWRFVQPALKKLSGLVNGWKPMFVLARSQDALKSDGKRETYCWGQLYLSDGVYHFQLAGGSQSSGNLINLAQTNGLAVLPVGQTAVGEGESVQVLQVGVPFVV